jgi:hypothetical protein
VAILIASVGLGIFLYLNSDEENFIEPTVNYRSKKSNPKSVTDTIDEVKTEDTVISETSTTNDSESLDQQQQKPEKNEKTWTEFQQEAKLNMSIHPNYELFKVDIDDKILSIYGTNERNGNKIAVLAGHGNFTTAQITDFINENKKSLKFLNGKDISIDEKPRIVPGPEGSGISKISLMNAGEVDGRVLNVAYIQRKDNLGSYLVILESSNGYTDSADGEIDRMYSSLKVSE